MLLSEWLQNMRTYEWASRGWHVLPSSADWAVARDNEIFDFNTKNQPENFLQSVP